MIILVGTYASLSGQPRRLSLDPHYLSAGRYSPDMTDPMVVSMNPAALGDIKGFAAALYTERKFMLEDLEQLLMAAVYTLPKSVAALSVNYLGNPAFSTLDISTGYGRSLGKINIGIRIKFESISVGQERKSVVDASVSSVIKLTQFCYSTLQFSGFSVGQPGQANLAPVYKFGLSYTASSKINTGLEFYKEEYRPPQFCINLYYKIAEKYFFRAGYISGAAELFAGAGWRRKQLQIHVIARQQFPLGITPALLFIYKNLNN